MKWICPKCSELNHGTRHESVLRHIRRKHDSIGEPINLNSGFTRRQLGLNPNRQSPYSGGLLTRSQSFALTSKSSTSDLCDWTEINILRPMRQQVELMSLMNQFNASSLGANLPMFPRVLQDLTPLCGCKLVLLTFLGAKFLYVKVAVVL